MTYHSGARRGLTIVEGVALVGVLAFLIALVIPGPAHHGYIDRVYEEDGKRTDYVLFVPHGYRGEKAYPLIFFMHGAGDAYRVTGVGLGPAIRPTAPERAKKQAGIWKAILKKEKEFPFFAVFPRIKEKWNTDAEQVARGFRVLDAVEKDYVIDKQRIYLTGLSNGGTAVWYQAAKQPQRWAAIVPISGAGNPKLAPAIKHIPCWCFHGADDRATSVEGARRMIEALREAGGNPRYTELEATGHNTWDEAYGKAELYRWLLQQRLPDAQ